MVHPPTEEAGKSHARIEPTRCARARFGRVDGAEEMDRRGVMGRLDVRDEHREEGLNELGEAPPPYKSGDSGSGSTRRSGESGQAILTVPLRTLSREGRPVHKPPDYHDTIREESREDGDPGEFGRSRGNTSSSHESTAGLREGAS